MRQWTCLLLVGWFSAAPLAAQVPVPTAAEPLPEGAIARLGTVRGRSGRGVAPHTLRYSPDGKQLASADYQTIRLFDAATGHEIRQFAPTAGAGAAPPLALGGGRGGRGSRGVSANSLTFAPNGKTLAAEVSGQVHVWDAATSQIAANWPVVGGPVRGSGSYSLSFAPGGQRLAGLRGYDPATDCPVLTIWNPANGEQVKQVNVGEAVSSFSQVAWFAYSPDGRSLAIATDGRPVLLLEAATGQVRAEWNVARGSPSPDGGRGQLGLAVQLLGGFGGGSSEGGGVAYTPDGRTLYAVTPDGHIAAWDVAASRERQRYGLAMTGSPLSLSTDGAVLAVRGPDNSLRVYDAATGRLRQRIADPMSMSLTNAFAVSPDGATLATADRGGVLRFWDTATGRERSPAEGHAGPVTLLAFAADGKTLVSVSAERVCAWDVASRKQRTTFDGTPANARLLGLSPDGQRLAAAGAGREVSVIGVPAGTPVRRLDDIAGGPFGLAFNADGGTLAASEGKAVKLWNLGTGAAQRTLDSGTGAVSQVRFSPDGRRLAGVSSVAGTGSVQLWDANSGQRLWEQAVTSLRRVGPDYYSDFDIGFPYSPDAESWAAGGPVFSADGTRLAVGGTDGQVHIFDAATGKESATLEGHAGWAAALAFSPDGKLLATGGSDRQVQIWDLNGGRLLHVLSGHQRGVGSLAFSPDGKLLASGGDDAVVLLWDATRFGARPNAVALELNEARVAQLWDDLSHSDAPKAYAAMLALASSPRPAVVLLRTRLKPAETVDPQRLSQLLADLDSPRFERREVATRELTDLGDGARSALEKFMAGSPSAEASQRAQALLKILDQPESSMESMRRLRALEVLEWAGTPEARAVLADLAKGAAGALVTREAQAALERLPKQGEKK